MRTVVGLKKVIFYAMHGYYETEKQTGNQFEITLKCHFVKKENQFVNYEDLYAVVKKVMETKPPLDFLESINEAIIEEVKNRFNFINKINIETIKLTPPIAQFKGKGTSVKMIWKK